MKKILLVLFLILGVAFAQQQHDYCLLNEDENGDVCFKLYAGQTIEIGTVCANDVPNIPLYRDVVVTVEEPWEIDIVHLWYGLNLEDVPQTSTGNPIPGRFPYSCVPSTTDPRTCTVRLSLLTLYNLAELQQDPTIPCDDYVWFAVHLAVHRIREDGSIDSQTAWSEGTRFVDRGNWAMYNYIYVLCDEDCADVPPPPPVCETSFAKADTNSQCFLSIPNQPAFNRWGWTNGPLTPGQYSFPIYAGAGQCDLSAGTLVGTLQVDYTWSSITVVFDLLPGYGMEETHLYVGSTILPLVQQGNKMVYTVAPGQYPYSHVDLQGANDDTYVITAGFPSIYIVAHAVVC